MKRATLADIAEIDSWVRRDFPDAGTLEGAVSDPLNVCLAEGAGGAIFVWRGPGIYETHCFFEQRGREVLTISQRFLDYMRRNHGATMFWAAIPDESRKVKLYVRMLGWKPAGHADFAHGRCELFTGE